jgi:O-methyltransferase involved in polyketide biosynthesis
MRFAPVDFERDTLAHGLEAAGFRSQEPAFFSWLGVVPYLTRDAAFATLRFIAGLPQHSGVIFDYAIPRYMLDEIERQAFDFLAEHVARAGEPFRLFFDPAQLSADLRTLGFTEIEDLDGAAIRRRWFGDGPEAPRRSGRSGRLLCARI